jgi:hypothetical protein
MNMKMKGKGIVRSAAYRVSAPDIRSDPMRRSSSRIRKKKKPEMMPTLNPDIASTCEVPVRWKRSFVSADMAVRSPMVSALSMSVCGAAEHSMVALKYRRAREITSSPGAADSTVP